MLMELMTRMAPSDPWARESRYLIKLPPVDAEVDERSPEDRRAAARLFDLNLRLVREMHAAGVGILAGSDTPEQSAPGFALHGELYLLQLAGLKPIDALRAATREPARYFSATDTLGSVRAGQVADLVILRANPLDDVRATREIEMVMTRGRLLTRSQLDSLLTNARDALARVQRSDAAAGAAARSRSPRSGEKPERR
jgi:imidazolonepropionase-like amidohydrolase